MMLYFCGLTEHDKIIQMLYFSHESNYISARMAPKAIEGPVIGINIERRRFFSMERAKPHHIPAGAAQIDIGGHHIPDVVAEFQFLNKGIRKRQCGPSFL